MERAKEFPENEAVSGPLIAWYETRRRDLPWRRTNDPYRIWISEIILQQTRVAQGLDYYNRFVERFPTVADLAAADLDEVLKLWQGLGYYSRARNLHAAARQVVDRFGGVFPRRYEEVLSLKGIGSYTAAAVCSFAYRAPYAVVDGNVYRVLSRLLGIDLPIDSAAGKKAFAEAADRLLDRNRPDLHNQAMMELGALQCVPLSPDCFRCPLQERCAAFASGRVAALPVKQGKTAVRDRYFHYIVVSCGAVTWLHQRTGKDIWQHLYEFPLLEFDAPVPEENLPQQEAFEKLLSGCGAAWFATPSVSFRHQLSHQTLHAVFHTVSVEREGALNERFIRIPHADLDRFPVSRLTLRYLEKRAER